MVDILVSYLVFAWLSGNVIMRYCTVVGQFGFWSSCTLVDNGTKLILVGSDGRLPKFVICMLEIFFRWC
jgi:hypothetical protein